MTTIINKVMYSRFPALLHIAFPLQPAQATGTLDASNPSQLILHIQLPFLLQDVWGVEVRDQDQLTVVYHFDMVDPGFILDWPVSKSIKSSPPDLFLYTYNLLGEYSLPYNVNNLALIPQISNLGVDIPTKRLTWQGDPKAAGYIVEVTWGPGAPDAQYAHFNLIHSALTQNQYYQMPDPEFFFNRTYTVTPYNAAGAGSSLTLNFQYIPTGVTDLTNQQVIPLPNPTLSITVPGSPPPPPPPTPTVIPAPIQTGGWGGDYAYYGRLPKEWK